MAVSRAFRGYAMVTLIAAVAAVGLAMITACATPPAITRIDTRDVVVTKIERPLTEQQVRETVPPAPMGRRPEALSAALDLALAQMCAWVRYAERADPMLQHSAGIPVTQRVNEPICQR